jgi:hypothetical protein
MVGAGLFLHDYYNVTASKKSLNICGIIFNANTSSDWEIHVQGCNLINLINLCANIPDQPLVVNFGSTIKTSPILL